jgi:hypothetical protein
MQRKIFRTIASVSFALVVVLGSAWQAKAQDAKAPYPSMCPLDVNDSALVGRARLNTCIKLITASLRYERFCDGHLGEVIKSGHVAAILRRLKRLADARTPE